MIDETGALAREGRRERRSISQRGDELIERTYEIACDAGVEHAGNQSSGCANREKRGATVAK